MNGRRHSSFSFIFYPIRSEQLVGIDPLIDKLLDAVDGGLTVGSIGDTEPLGGGVKHFAGGRAVVDELVDHQRDEELCLEVLHVLRVAEELLEIGFRIVEIVGCEAPHIHRYRHVLFKGLPFALFVLVADGVALVGLTQDLGTLYYIRQMALLVVGTDATGHAAVF